MRRHRALSIFTASLILLAGQADGQQLVHRIGVLQNEEITEIKEAWEDGLRELGYFPDRTFKSSIATRTLGASGFQNS
jgi:hypothetical protein